MAEPTAASKVVYVVPDLPYGFQVQPPVVRLRRRGELVVRNLTQSLVHVSFPSHVMRPSSGDVAPQGSTSFTVLEEAPVGVYDYQVTIVLVQEDRERGIEEVSLRARGNSDPRIIIDF
jgi:hypothetical protein